MFLFQSVKCCSKIIAVVNSLLKKLVILLLSKATPHLKFCTPSSLLLNVNQGKVNWGSRAYLHTLSFVYVC